MYFLSKLIIVAIAASVARTRFVPSDGSGPDDQSTTFCDTVREQMKDGTYDRRKSGCEERTILTCTDGKVEVCDWTTMQARLVNCVYNVAASRCEEQHLFRYRMETPCEIHDSKSECQRAISPESVDYAVRRHCEWREKDGGDGVCQSPMPAYFYMLTTSGFVFRFDPFQKKLEYVFNQTGARALAANPRHVGGLYLTYKTEGNDLDQIVSIGNIEKALQGSTRQPRGSLPLRGSDSILGENNDGNLLTTGKDDHSLYIHSQSGRGKHSVWKKRSNGCERRKEGDIAMEPSTSLTGLSRLVTASSGRILDVLSCKRYNWIIGEVEGLAFTCNGDLYAGAENRIYKVDASGAKSEPIMVLEGYDIIDFASQPGCHVHRQDCKRRKANRRR
eukprot:m.110050 g.110050  ORF g.110050 m.110050 type:complete len:389 (+) comp37384_c0_seq1:914-2080(+)